jgi:hypothetical protein
MSSDSIVDDEFVSRMQRAMLADDIEIRAAHTQQHYPFSQRVRLATGHEKV